MSDTVDWRDKYRTLAVEAERHEQQIASAVEQMRSLAVQLNLLTHGQSADLDVLLESVMSTLQAGELAPVQGLLRETEKQVRLLEDSRARFADSLISRLYQWIELLLRKGSDYSGTLNDIKKRLDDEPEDIYRLPGVIDTLLDVQKGLSSVAGPAVDDDDISDFKEGLSARLAARLLELLQQLNVPAEHRGRVHALIKRLEAVPGADALEECLHETSELVRACEGSFNSDIQEYLSNLNIQLGFLRSFVDSTDQLELKQRKRNNLLDQSVRHDVRMISNTVKSSLDINDLKKSVNSQLVSIIQAMNQHKVAEKEHLELLGEERKTLISRLDEMEHRAEQFRKSAEDAHLTSMTDPLTGLPNRLAYDRQLAHEFERFRRYSTPFSMCIADIDLFKRINDQYGHLAGDKVLRLTAKVLRTNLRGVDFVARIGGEEFVILLPSTAGDSAKETAEKVRKALEHSPFNFHGSPVNLTMSFGVTEVQPDDTAESLFARADRLVYEAKNAGRNCVRKN